MTSKDSSILVVDDDENQRWMLKKYLQKHGFNVEVAEDGATMRTLINTTTFELVLLDVSMPGEDGFAVARYLREHHDVGIIMLTAAGDLFDRVLGLEIGADDYITKPFEPRELLARVRSVLRRIDVQQQKRLTGEKVVPLNEIRLSTQRKSAEQENTVTGKAAKFGCYYLDTQNNLLVDENGKQVAITPMEFDLLKAFADNPGKVLSRDKLLLLAHKQEVDPFDRSIDIRIARVRRKIEQDPSKPSVIKTVRGRGYVYVPEKRDKQ